MPSETFTTGQALDLLRDQIQDHLEALQEATKQAVDQNQFSQAQALLQQAQAITSLLSDLDAWSQRFEELIATENEQEGETEDIPRLPKGLKTPQSAYRVPILRALVTLGGEADIDVVLERVKAMMAAQLNDYDLATLTDGTTLRWRNTAQWARNSMREEGLIQADTPRGLWRISDKGKRWLKAQTERC